jgi:5-methylcytosine-specific restriction enzyme A
MALARPTATQRGYDAQWFAASALFKAHNPFCLGCLAIGLSTPTEVVDHIVPHQGDNMLFWNEANWQPACAWHYNAIKPTLERQWRAGKIRDMALRLDSPQAKALTRAKHKPAIGADGYPIAGT